MPRLFFVVAMLVALAACAPLCADGSIASRLRVFSQARRSGSRALASFYYDAPDCVDKFGKDITGETYELPENAVLYHTGFTDLPAKDLGVRPLWLSPDLYESVVALTQPHHEKMISLGINQVKHFVVNVYKVVKPVELVLNRGNAVEVTTRLNQFSAGKFPKVILGALSRDTAAGIEEMCKSKAGWRSPFDQDEIMLCPKVQQSTLQQIQLFTCPADLVRDGTIRHPITSGSYYKWGKESRSQVYLRFRDACKDWRKTVGGWPDKSDQQAVSADNQKFKQFKSQYYAKHPRAGQWVPCSANLEDCEAFHFRATDIDVIRDVIAKCEPRNNDVKLDTGVYEKRA